MAPEPKVPNDGVGVLLLPNNPLLVPNVGFGMGLVVLLLVLKKRSVVDLSPAKLGLFLPVLSLDIEILVLPTPKVEPGPPEYE